MITCRHRQFAHNLGQGFRCLPLAFSTIPNQLPFPIQSHSLSLSLACAIQEYYDAYYAGTNDSKEKTVSNAVDDDDDKEVDDIFFPDWLKDFDNLEQKFGGVFDQVTAAAFNARASPQSAFCKINSF